MKLEYLYYDPGEATVPLVNAFLSANGRTGAEAVTNQKGRVTGHINPAGLNYHFNRCAAPVVVKYRSELIFLPLCMSGPPAGCLKMKYFSLKWPQCRGPA